MFLYKSPLVHCLIMQPLVPLPRCWYNPPSTTEYIHDLTKPTQSAPSKLHHPTYTTRPTPPKQRHPKSHPKSTTQHAPSKLDHPTCTSPSQWVNILENVALFIVLCLIRKQKGNHNNRLFINKYPQGIFPPWHSIWLSRYYIPNGFTILGSVTFVSYNGQNTFRNVSNIQCIAYLTF